MAQGAKVSGAGIIVLEEVRIDIELFEQDLRNRLVAVVSAAKVDSDFHVRGALGDGFVDELCVFAGQRREVFVALLLSGFAHVWVAQVREVGVVELDEAAAGLVEGVELFLVYAREVVEEDVEVGVCGDVDGGAAAAEVHHCGRGDADFGRRLAAVGLDGFFEELEVLDLDGFGVAELALDDEGWRREAVLVPDVAYLALLFDTREVLQEVEMEVCATELAISYGAQAILDLLLCDVVDPFIFNFAELFAGDLAIGSVGASEPTWSAR
jgi:hypothetical protein